MDKRCVDGEFSVDDMYGDFKARTVAFIKALTDEVDKFLEQCDPERENLCLYAYQDETWEVYMPIEEVPPEFSEPTLGINFAKRGMEPNKWLALVTVHSDCWLFAVAFYFGARFGFDKRPKIDYLGFYATLPYTGLVWLGLQFVLTKIFQKINDLPSLFDVVSNGLWQSKEQPGSSSRIKNKSNKKTSGKSKKPKPEKIAEDKESEKQGGEEKDEDDSTQCGTCGKDYNGEFWIFCDFCKNWFHGRCMKMTPAKAQYVDKYECPRCTMNNKAIV